MAMSPFSLELDSIPLFFRYRDIVFGRGFAATVETSGRALLEREDGEFVMAGVEPGGMAVSGETREAAHEAFRKTFTEVLFDIAADAEGFRHSRQKSKPSYIRPRPPRSPTGIVRSMRRSWPCA